MDKLINEVITDIRKKHKLSRKGLENLSGFKERTIIGYERGERKPPKKYIEFMSLYFNYKTEYVEAISFDDKNIDTVLRTLLIYQSINNYDDNKMSELLADYRFNYKELKEDLKTSRYHRKSDSNENFFIIAEILKIKPSNIYGNLESHKMMRLKKEKLDKFHKIADDNPNMNHDEINHLSFVSDDERKKLFKDIVERENLAEKNGIDITPTYYASIIKKRNQPKSYTPMTELNEIPQKYKEILELLPSAPDSFIATLTEKLKTLKEAQQL